MSEHDFRRKLAKLRTAIIIKESQVVANPLPYLKDMERRCNELLAVLEEVERALSPDIIFDYWEMDCDKNAIPRPNDIQGEAYIRCTNALKVINKFKTA